MKTAQIHIKLDDDIHRKLKKQASTYNYSLQEFTEKILQLACREPQRLFEPSASSHESQGTEFTFIDLFAGIGGIRIAFEKHGGKCVFSSEWDKWCQKTYFENFGEIPHGDINRIRPEDIPDHDILAAGFPCQPFSIAGVSKKNSLGMAHGFKDKTQGTLFFRIAEIIQKKRPKAFLLENVKNLMSHDKGNTFRVIDGTLRELGYHVDSRIFDAISFVPQHRERLFIVGFDNKEFGGNHVFAFPKINGNGKPALQSILERKVAPKYTLTDKLWNYLQAYAKKHREKGNGFGYGLVGPSDTTRTLSARYYKDGSEILIKTSGSNPRKLTPRECARLMGFDDDFIIPVSDTQAYRQFGNSVVVPVVSVVAKEVVKAVKKLNKN